MENAVVTALNGLVDVRLQIKIYVPKFGHRCVRFLDSNRNLTIISKIAVGSLVWEIHLKTDLLIVALVAPRRLRILLRFKRPMLNVFVYAPMQTFSEPFLCLSSLNEGFLQYATLISFITLHFYYLRHEGISTKPSTTLVTRCESNVRVKGRIFDFFGALNWLYHKK